MTDQEPRPSSDDRDRETAAGRVRRPRPTRTTTPARSRGRHAVAGASASSRRATSPPTTSRSCSTSPTSTVTSTWTSRATGPRSRSSAPTCSSSSGRNGEVLDALQELTRLAVYRETGERSRLMLDVSGYRAEQARGAVALAETDDRRGEGVRRAGVAGPDVAVRAQGRPRRRGRRRADLGVRGRRAASLRGGPARELS